MWHKPCRTFHPWCPCIKTRCLFKFIDTRKSCILPQWFRTQRVSNVELMWQEVSVHWNLHFSYILKFISCKEDCRSHRNLSLRYQSTNSNPLQWRHYDDVSNHQPHDCSLKRLFRRRSKKTSKLRVTGLCAWNSPVTGEFSAQMGSKRE